MKYKLSEIFDLQMGKTPSRNNEKYWGDGYKWVSIADIGKASKYIEETKENITDVGVSESGIKKVPQNTVIMSFKLSIGKTAITAEDMYTNEAIMAFIDKKVYPVDTNYFYHLCAGKDWSAGTNKAVMGLTLNKATLSEIEIELPPIDEQKAVATELDFIDSLITSRREQLAKLDELVKSQFIELFGIEAKSFGAHLCDYASVFGGYAFKSKEFLNEGVPIIRISDIDGETVSVDKAVCYPQSFWENNQSYRVIFNDILMAMSGATIGKIGMVTLDVPLLLNQRVACIRAKQPEYAYFLATILKMPWVQDIINNSSPGSAQPNISGKQIEQLPIPAATDRQIKQLSRLAAQTDKSKLAIQESLEKLETLKKALMQKYFG